MDWHGWLLDVLSIQNYPRFVKAVLSRRRTAVAGVSGRFRRSLRALKPDVKVIFPPVAGANTSSSLLAIYGLPVVMDSSPPTGTYAPSLKRHAAVTPI